MVSRAAINDFLSEKSIAVVGVSRDSKKFGSTVFRELKSKGYKLYPVNPNTDLIGVDKCYHDLRSVPVKINAALIVTKPEETEKVVKDAAGIGIKKIWMAQGAESQSAIRFCEDQNIEVISKECPLMFAEPAAFVHRTHRFINRLIGRLPK